MHYNSNLLVLFKYTLTRLYFQIIDTGLFIALASVVYVDCIIVANLIVANLIVGRMIYKLRRVYSKSRNPFIFRITFVSPFYL